LKTGRVDAFDEQVGLGTVRSADGEVYPFHCTAIADGSRAIAVGATVAFVVQPGLAGRWEAGGLVTMSEPEAAR
jgi:cold shock CspA family protein